MLDAKALCRCRAGVVCDAECRSCRWADGVRTGFICKHNQCGCKEARQGKPRQCNEAVINLPKPAEIHGHALPSCMHVSECLIGTHEVAAARVQARIDS